MSKKIFSYKIRIKIFLIIIFIGLSNLLSATNSDSLFTQANSAYNSSDFQKAIELYEQFADSGYQSAEVYFNLGNAYYKQNYLSLAIINYERAKRVDPYDEAINYNLEHANAFKVDKIEEIPVFFLKTWVTNLTLLLSFETWGRLSLILFGLLIIFILIYLFTPKLGLKKLSFIAALLFALFSLLSFVMAHKRNNIQFANDIAIITSSSVTVKSSPDESGTDLFLLHEGTKVTIEDKVGEWYEIKIADGNTGWIGVDKLEIV